MKKILFLCLIAVSCLNGMQAPVEESAGSWNLLPEEVKQHILSYVPIPGSYRELAALLATNKETQRLVTDPRFIQEFAQRSAQYAPEQAKELLEEAARNGKIDLVKELVKADSELNKFANNLLFNATKSDFSNLPQSNQADARKNNLTFVETLLAAGADPNTFGTATRGGSFLVDSTALIESIVKANTELIEPLLKYGARINEKDELDATPLEKAISEENEKAVQLLLEHKADPNASLRGILPIMRAMETANKNIVKLLIDHGADLNPLHPPFPGTLAEAERSPLALARFKEGITSDPNLREKFREIVDLLEKTETPSTSGS